MSLNSPYPSNFSLLNCSLPNVSFIIGAAFTVTKAFLLLPLSILVLYLGLQRWRQQRSFTTTSHSDIFTYHMAAMELIWGLGSAFFFFGASIDLPEMVQAGYYVFYINLYGETFFHLLTCVERYLAVVHPITYLGLRNARGVRIRNISIGCVWLLCFVCTCLISLKYSASPTLPFFSPVVLSLVVISFCSLSVLRVLIRPGPGEGGQDKERVDLSKHRAFLTILAITGCLWLWFVGFLVSEALINLELLSPSVNRVVKTSALWFSLPSSLVLPLLYLQRAGKLVACCSYNSG